MRMLIVPSAVLVFLVGACSQPAPAPAAKVDLASEEKTIREMDASWLKASQGRDAAGAAAVFASDGVAYREPLGPLVGPAAFQAYQTKFQTDNPKLNVTWSTDAIRIADSGDLAIQTGEYHLTGLRPEWRRRRHGPVRNGLEEGKR